MLSTLHSSHLLQLLSWSSFPTLQTVLSLSFPTLAHTRFLPANALVCTPSEGCIGLGTALLDTFDAEIKAPLLFDEMGAGGGSSDFAGLNSSIGFSSPSAASSTGKPRPAPLEGPGAGTDLSFDGETEAGTAVNVTSLLEGNCDQERGALLILCLLTTPEFVHPIVDAGAPLRLINLSKVCSCVLVCVRSVYGVHARL
jgi:hypothetical protein